MAVKKPIFAKDRIVLALDFDNLEDLFRQGAKVLMMCAPNNPTGRVWTMDELKQIRISHAKQLLRYSSDSVEEIGKKCGFDSPSYFALRFREITGRTPLEYRKQYR